jgi:hypothetical protein
MPDRWKLHFQIDWRNFFTSRCHDNLFDAAKYTYPSINDFRLITGTQPTINKCFGSIFFTLPVTAHDVGPRTCSSAFSPT